MFFFADFRRDDREFHAGFSVGFVRCVCGFCACFWRFYASWGGGERTQIEGCGLGMGVNTPKTSALPTFGALLLAFRPCRSS